METVNKAGSDLVESSAGEEAANLRSKLENLNQRWKAILEKTAKRKQKLESALLQVLLPPGQIIFRACLCGGATDLKGYSDWAV